MRTLLAVVAMAAALVLPSTSSAHGRRHFVPNGCQVITVVSQTNVRPQALALVEYATVLQSWQLRHAWGTPCVQFGPGGWVLTLSSGVPQHNPDGSVSYVIAGEHCGPLGTPGTSSWCAQTSISVETGYQTYGTWARAFTHEVMETLVDPTAGVRWRFGLEEVCDPVENYTYSYASVPVTDFVFPSYFTGGPGPYDQMGLVTESLAALLGIA